MDLPTPSRNTKALATLAQVLAWLTYCGAVIYGDVMFINVMHTAFPDGLMGALATAGAIMTAVSAIALPIALHYWFSPGLQFLWGIIFWGLDVVALGLNAILAYGVATNRIDPALMQWQNVSPATPLIAVIGWGIAFLLDPAYKLRHAQAELESDLIDIHSAQLRNAAKGESVVETITQGAKLSAAETASKLTGQVITPAQLSTPSTAFARDGANPVTLASAGGGQLFTTDQVQTMIAQALANQQSNNALPK